MIKLDIYTKKQGKEKTITNISHYELSETEVIKAIELYLLGIGHINLYEAHEIQIDSITTQG